MYYNIFTHTVSGGAIFLTDDFSADLQCFLYKFRESKNENKKYIFFQLLASLLR